MPRTVPDDYFSEGVWSATGPLGFRSHTCTVCGARSKTWAAFRAHRAGPDCAPAPLAGRSNLPDWATGAMPQADRDALTALALQLPDPDPIDTAQWAEETLA